MELAAVMKAKSILERVLGASGAAVCLCCTLLWCACSSATDSTTDKPQAVAAPTVVESSDLLQRAKDRTSRGDTAGAIASYTELLRDEPAQISALGNRAALLASMGRLDEALADYDMLLDVDSRNYAALDRRADLKYRMRRYREALQDLGYIAEYRKGDPKLLNRIGESHLRLGEYAQANQAFSEALSILANWPVPLRNRAHTYYMMGDFESARADYQHLLDLNRNDSEGLNGMGLVQQFADQDLLGAETNYRRAVLSNPRNAGAWYNIAFLEAGQNKTQLAIMDFGKAIQWDPNYVEAFINRGLLLMNGKQVAEARADFEQAYLLEPSNAHTRLLLGWAKCEMGERTSGCLDLAEAKAQKEPGADRLIDAYCK